MVAYAPQAGKGEGVWVSPVNIQKVASVSKDKEERSDDKQQSDEGVPPPSALGGQNGVHLGGVTDQNVAFYGHEQNEKTLHIMRYYITHDTKACPEPEEVHKWPKLEIPRFGYFP